MRGSRVEWVVVNERVFVWGAFHVGDSARRVETLRSTGRFRQRKGRRGLWTVTDSSSEREEAQQS